MLRSIFWLGVGMGLVHLGYGREKAGWTPGVRGPSTGLRGLGFRLWTSKSKQDFEVREDPWENLEIGTVVETGPFRTAVPSRVSHQPCVWGMSPHQPEPHSPHS